MGIGGLKNVELKCQKINKISNEENVNVLASWTLLAPGGDLGNYTELPIYIEFHKRKFLFVRFFFQFQDKSHVVIFFQKLYLFTIYSSTLTIVFVSERLD